MRIVKEEGKEFIENISISEIKLNGQIPDSTLLITKSSNTSVKFNPAELYIAQDGNTLYVLQCIKNGKSLKQQKQSRSDKNRSRQ